MTRVGLVGYGSSGATFHAPLLRAAGLDLVAVVSANPERADQARAENPGVTLVPDVGALLALPGLDLVVVASPSGRHVENAEAIIEAGIAVVVDKPLACDAGGAQGLVDLAAGRGVPLTVFQNRRYDPEFHTMRDLLHRGVLGELRRTEFRWERWRPVPKNRWRELVTPAEGGGLMLDLHTHLIDQAVLLHGPVASVYAEVEAWTTTGEDDTFLALRHTSGYSTHLTASSVAGAPGPRARIVGSTGTHLLGAAGDEPTAFPDANGAPISTAGWSGARSASPCWAWRATRPTSTARSPQPCVAPSRRRVCRSTPATPSTCWPSSMPPESAPETPGSSTSSPPAKTPPDRRVTASVLAIRRSGGPGQSS